MQILSAISLAIIFLSWPLATGILASKLGRNFWFWFFMGLPLPFIAVAILLFIPHKLKRSGWRPVERENGTTILYQEQKSIGHKKHYSASA